MNGVSDHSEGDRQSGKDRPVKPTRPTASGTDFLNRIVAAQRRQAGSRPKRDNSAPLLVAESSSYAHDAGGKTDRLDRVQSSREPRGNGTSNDATRVGRNLALPANRPSNRERSRPQHSLVDRQSDGEPDDAQDFIRDLPGRSLRETSAHLSPGFRDAPEKRLFDVSSGTFEERRSSQRDMQIRSLGSSRDASREGSRRESAHQGEVPAVTAGTRTQQQVTPNGRNSIWSRGGGMGDIHAQSSSTGRKLFNPSLHDPLAFQKATGPIALAVPGTSPHVLSLEPPSSTKYHRNNRSAFTNTQPDSRSQMSTGPQDRILGRTNSAMKGGAQEEDVTYERRQYKITTEQVDQDDIAGDRARERRKRKEGSEKGSLNVAHHRKRDEERSRGSRSSEGSESLKDRERGRGKR